MYTAAHLSEISSASGHPAMAWIILSRHVGPLQDISQIYMCIDQTTSAMLNSPLSLLSDELLERIVDEVAGDDDFLEVRWLKRLSIVHRAFTTLRQSRLSGELRLYGSKSDMTTTLKRAHETLNLKHLPISFVRRIRLDVNRQRNISWLFQDKHFISLVRTLSKVPHPPLHIQIYGYNSMTG